MSRRNSVAVCVSAITRSTVASTAVRSDQLWVTYVRTWIGDSAYA